MPGFTQTGSGDYEEEEGCEGRKREEEREREKTDLGCAPHDVAAVASETTEGDVEAVEEASGGEWGHSEVVDGADGEDGGVGGELDVPDID